jgi:hypothetical protein
MKEVLPLLIGFLSGYSTVSLALKYRPFNDDTLDLLAGLLAAIALGTVIRLVLG